MKKAICIMMFLSFPLSALGAESGNKVLKNSSGYHILTSEKDTGIMIEEGLSLTSEEFARIIEEGREVPLNSTVELSWSNLTHLMRKSQATKVARLDNNGFIRAIEKQWETAEEIFNLFFLVASVYIILMMFVNFAAGRLNKFRPASILLAALAAAFAALAAIVASAAFAAFAAFAAAFVAGIATNNNDVKAMKIASMAGIVFMAVAMVLCYNLV